MKHPHPPPGWQAHSLTGRMPSRIIFPFSIFPRASGFGRRHRRPGEVSGQRHLACFSLAESEAGVPTWERGRRVPHFALKHSYAQVPLSPCPPSNEAVRKASRKGTIIKSIKHDVQRRPAGEAVSICPSGSTQAGLRPRLLPEAAREKGPGPPKPPPEAGPPRAPEPGEPPRPRPPLSWEPGPAAAALREAAAPRAPDAHRAAGAAPLLAARAALCRAELLRASAPAAARELPPARPPRGCAEVRASAAGDLKPRPAKSSFTCLSWRAPARPGGVRGGDSHGGCVEARLALASQPPPSPRRLRASVAT